LQKGANASATVAGKVSKKLKRQTRTLAQAIGAVVTQIADRTGMVARTAGQKSGLLYRLGLVAASLELCAWSETSQRSSRDGLGGVAIVRLFFAVCGYVSLTI